MIDLNVLSKKQGFAWLFITEIVFLCLAIKAAFDGNYDIAVLLLILIEIRSYIFAKIK